LHLHGKLLRHHKRPFKFEGHLHYKKLNKFWIRLSNRILAKATRNRQSHTAGMAVRAELAAQQCHTRHIRIACGTLHREAHDSMQQKSRIPNSQLQTELLVAGLSCVIPHELGFLRLTRRIFMVAKLNVLRELLVKLLVVSLLLGNLYKHPQALLNKVILDHS